MNKYSQTEYFKSPHYYITVCLVKSTNTDSRQNAEQNILETIIRNRERKYGLFSFLLTYHYKQLQPLSEKIKSQSSNLLKAPLQEVSHVGIDVLIR